MKKPMIEISPKYIVDSTGKKTEAVLDITTFEQMLEYLEDIYRSILLIALLVVTPFTHADTLLPRAIEKQFRSLIIDAPSVSDQKLESYVKQIHLSNPTNPQLLQLLKKYLEPNIHFYEKYKKHFLLQGVWYVLFATITGLTAATIFYKTYYFSFTQLCTDINQLFPSETDGLYPPSQQPIPTPLSYARKAAAVGIMFTSSISLGCYFLSTIAFSNIFNPYNKRIYEKLVFLKQQVEHELSLYLPQTNLNQQLQRFNTITKHIELLKNRKSERI